MLQKDDLVLEVQDWHFGELSATILLQSFLTMATGSGNVYHL